ncbi:App1 family protein [Massilia yuzhufengensis]|uniref:Phosphatidate phosphatase APP1 n=1 Tax=Massilia yuzhufengensis TaxID=1164594 RepID=A0A1I1PRB4_9BURK|nr:phosphatase domain-containing protein [Massilia yuzhufengensis]SFD10158.1 Phosphatidate phosphatase APP1 [Massilia yuzhufengensis]
MTTSPMPFLVLTRAGFDDLAQRVDLGRATLFLNPGLLQAEDIARLRESGTAVHVMATTVDPLKPQEVQQALLLVRKESGSAWVERGVATAQRASGAVTPATSLRQRLARSAGAFATQALRQLRAPEQGRRLMAVPYLGFGNASRIWVKGRLLDENSFRDQALDDSGWQNLVALYRRLESDEVADARVVARFAGTTQETRTDRGGYFSFEIAPGTALVGGWHQVQLEFPDNLQPDGQPLHAVAEVRVPAETARFGIISDIDDTVLWTNVTNKLNMALMLARTNSHTRKPFKGVAAFYRALNEGVGSAENNPMFYVSSSPWHLYGPLVDFLKLQRIPVGPLLLRELSVRQVLKINEHGNHKLEQIERILDFYPDMQFVLIGDSGEQDPEIYTEVVRRHPASVKMIYIRNVNPDPARIDALDRLIEEVSATGIQLVISPDSVFAASHAAAEGLIAVDRLGAVRSDKREDETAAAVKTGV